MSASAISQMMDRWIILAAVCVKISFFSGCMKANGVILDDTVNKVNGSNSLVAWAFAMQNGLAYMFSPVVSLFMNTVSSRKLCIFGGTIVGFTYIYLGLEVDSVLQLFIAYCLSGIGYSLLHITTYLAVKHNFPDSFPTIVSIASSFNFIGVAIIPPTLQLLKDVYGYGNSLILFGAITWNLIVVGVCMRQPRHQKADKGTLHRFVHKEKGNDVTDDMTKPEKKQAIRNIFTSFQSHFSVFVQHKTFSILALLESLTFYMYLSWALFLVSLGKSAGLSPDQSVFLSTVGGCGGFLGKLSAGLLHHGNLMNPYTSSFIPLLLNSFFLLGCAVLTKFYYLLIVVFLSGYCLGLNSSGVFGLIPSVVCDYHFPKAIAMNYFFDGITMQLGGLFSGFLYDFFGSPKYIFFFDALVSLLSLPLVVFWSCRNEKVTNCKAQTE